MIVHNIRHTTIGWILILLLFAVNAWLIQQFPVSAAGETLTIGAPVVFSSGYTISSAQFIDNANSAYFLDPAATGNSLVTAGDATVSGNIALGNTKTIRSAFGPLQLQYKSGLDAWTTGLTIQDTTGNVILSNLVLSGQSSAPTSPSEGQAYYNSTDKEFYGYKNAQWSRLIADDRGSCPTGYVLVPGSSTFSTEDFCVMKYEAKQDANKNPTSAATGTPWVSVDWYEAKAACTRAGAHLVTNAEWMTIARNIESTTINDLDDDAGLQLATGHSDTTPPAAQAATAGSDPVVSGCNLAATMENATNAYAASSCEIRGDGSYGGDDADKGFYGTSQTWSATGYQAGWDNKSQLRTNVLSNGSVIWDVSGNVLEWSDWQCGTSVWYNSAAWIQWDNANVTDYEKYAAGPNGSLTNTNGAGRYYGCSAAGNAAVRSGADNMADDGPFMLYLGFAPASVVTNVGFRCAK